MAVLSRIFAFFKAIFAIFFRFIAFILAYFDNFDKSVTVKVSKRRVEKTQTFWYDEVTETRVVYRLQPLKTKEEAP